MPSLPPPPSLLHHHHHHLNEAHIVGITSVANGGGPVAGALQEGGEEGTISGTSANNTTRVNITVFDPIHKS